MPRIKSGFVLLLLFFSVLLHAQGVYTLPYPGMPVSIGNKFVFLRDATHRMKLNDVLQSNGFKANNQAVPNYDVTKDAIWGKIKLTCKQAADWYIVSDIFSLNKITFYQKRGDGQWQVKSYGNAVAETQNDYQGRLTVKLDVQPGDTTLLLFRVHDYYPQQYDFKAGTLDAFVKHFYNTDIYNGICFGVMIMMIIYNLYLFITQKQSVYLYYVLYVSFNGIFLAVYSGYFFYLPRFIRPFALHDPMIFPAGFGVFLVLFTLKLFKGYIPRTLQWVLYAFMAIAALDIITGALGMLYFAFNAIRIMGLFLGVLCITSGVVAQRNKSSSARFYILGFSAYLGGLAFLILSGHLLPVNSASDIAVLTGSMVECVFLSFAQADKLKVFQLEKEKAQQETLAQVQKNERLIREQNIVLEQKVNQRTAQLAEKNREVLDSITYSKRLQDAILPPLAQIKQYFPESFVLYKPKDIVAGDFYWVAHPQQSYARPEYTGSMGREKEQNDGVVQVLPTGEDLGGAVLIAACDCTGHGVPGAMMSVVCSNALNRVVKEFGLTEPGKILDKTRELVLETFGKSEGEIKDGMDVSLISLSPSEGGIQIQWAGAYNPLWYIEGGELKEIIADKQPIGKTDNPKPFTTHTITFYPHRGDEGGLLYLFTDGYADQFGGPFGKKFKSKHLQQLLSANWRMTMEEQKNILEKQFESWKGDLEQTDDVCVVGIRISQ